MLRMKKKYAIHPDFYTRVKLPFSAWSLRVAKGVQRLRLKMTPILEGVQSKRYIVKGYKGLDVPVEVFEPEVIEEKLPCLFYIHGGAFGFMASPHHKKLACIYAKEAKCRVIFPDYHLLPKYKYPVAYEDVLAVYRWMCESVKVLEIDEKRIAIGGDSAGGTLAINLCNSIGGNQLIQPCFQMLIYPVTDATLSTESMRKYTDTPMWHAVNNQKMWQMYLKNASQEEQRMASPMQNILPTKIPDTYMETAEFDCLHDEGCNYAEKLKEAGAEVVLYETKGTIHGYDFFLESVITKASIEKRVNALQKAFLSATVKNYN